jgi:hypothetical protein
MKFKAFDGLNSYRAIVVRILFCGCGVQFSQCAVYIIQRVQPAYIE